MNQFKPTDILPEPPEELKQHSARLTERIRARITDEGPVSFAEFMEMALYEPGLGYYSAGLHKFGAEGDFVTAPELGDVFGACLAKQIKEVSAETEDFEILEIGAGSGKLAAQLLAGAARQSRRGRRSYKILERSADLKAVQQETIETQSPDDARRVEWLDVPPTGPWQGVILANEVVDALPVERFFIQDGAVMQTCVDEQDGTLKFCDRPAPEELDAAVRALGDLPEGYRSEINLRLAEWVATVTEQLERGVVLFVDYGYPQSEFYLPERSDGTLIAHYRHRAHNDVLRWPGLQDITAFVNFTALSHAGMATGLDLLGYTSQALFLMSCGLDEVVQSRLSGDAERDMLLNNEVRQLVMPGLMGEKFQVMAFGRGWPESKLLRGFSFRDLGERL